MQFLHNIYCFIVIASLMIIGISTAFVYFHWYLKSDINITNINPGAETVIY